MTAQANNPLHGVTLEKLLTELVAHYGWAELGRQIEIRCFNIDPSIPSSLKFLRRTPWARERVESLYLYMLHRREGRGSLHRLPNGATQEGVLGDFHGRP